MELRERLHLRLAMTVPELAKLVALRAGLDSISCLTGVGKDLFVLRKVDWMSTLSSVGSDFVVFRKAGHVAI